MCGLWHGVLGCLPTCFWHEGAGADAGTRLISTFGQPHPNRLIALPLAIPLRCAPLSKSAAHPPCTEPPRSRQETLPQLLRRDNDLEVGSFDFPQFFVQDRDALVWRHREGPLDAVVGHEHPVAFERLEDHVDRG